MVERTMDGPAIFLLLLLAALISTTSSFQGVSSTQSSRKAFPTFSSSARFSKATTTSYSTNDRANPQAASDKVSVVLCPAQFCVPADYEELFDNLKQTRAETQETLPKIGTCRVAPLSRNEWIKVAKQLPTKNFLDSTLSAKTTLDWYFTAIENALAEIFAEEGHDTRICFIGHSIGGWVARGYLGGLSGCVQYLCCVV